MTLTLLTMRCVLGVCITFIQSGWRVITNDNRRIFSIYFSIVSICESILAWQRYIDNTQLIIYTILMRRQVGIYIYIYIRKNFVILLQENDPIFFQNSFYSGSVYMRRVRQCTVDGRSASWGAWQGHAHFSLYCNNSRTVWYFHLILFAAIRCASGNAEKIIKKNPTLTMWAWQGHALFSLYVAITWERLDIFN